MKKILFYFLFVSVNSWSMDTLEQMWKFKAQFVAHHFWLHHTHTENNHWVYDDHVKCECHECSYVLNQGLQAFDDTMLAIKNIKAEPGAGDSQTSS